MDEWYYNESGGQRGPVSGPEIKNLLASNRISPATLVWREGMPQWASASSIAAFDISPYASPVSDSPAGIDWSGYSPSGPQVRPWIRYWARTADFLLFCLVLGLILGIVAPEWLESTNDTVFGLVLLLVYNFVEPLFLSICGATPFKALFLVRVRNNDGSKPGYVKALVRTLTVWLRGVGLGIPVLTLVTHLVCYSRLTQNGITSWDADGHFTVSHREVAWWRWLILLGFFAGFIWLMAIGSQA